MPYLKKPKQKPRKRFNQLERFQIYKSTRWKRLREAKLLQQPLCEICLKEGKTEPATDVHHIYSFLNYDGNERLWKAYDFNNLMSICKYHHGLIHTGMLNIQIAQKY